MGNALLHLPCLLGLLLLSSAFQDCSAAKVKHLPIGPYKRATRGAVPLTRPRSDELISQCKESYREAGLDHFSWVSS